MNTIDENRELKALQMLREKIRALAEAEAEKEAAEKALQDAEGWEPAAVEEFDRLNREKYIVSQIGPRPPKVRGIVRMNIPAIRNPVFRPGRKHAPDENADYARRYDRFAEAYYEDYAEKRSQIETEERERMEERIRQAQELLEEANARLTGLREELDADDTLGVRMKNAETVDTLIGYFTDRRADTVKEAVNLYYEEDHRSRLEEYAREQLSITEEAKTLAREAAQSAERAASSALKAAKLADEAVSQAKNATERADEAIQKVADSAAGGIEALELARKAVEMAEEASNMAVKASSEARNVHLEALLKQ